MASVLSVVLNAIATKKKMEPTEFSSPRLAEVREYSECDWVFLRFTIVVGKGNQSLPIPKSTRTPVPLPRTSPLESVIATDRLEHNAPYSDSTTPTCGTLSEGVQSCEIWLAVSDVVPSDPNAYRFVYLSTRTPETVTVEAADGGKMATYPCVGRVSSCAA